DKPELVNAEPYGAGWLVKVSVADAAEVGKLLSAAEYEQLIAK
ncbi:MAG: glycine cleavage system protein H, partial [Tannerellaceae bacterium]